MPARRTLAPALLLSLAALLTAACTEERQEPEDPGNRDSRSASPAPTWDGKEDQEEAMERATRALNAVEAGSASREDSGTAALGEGLDRTFTTPGVRPYTFGVACQTPTPRTLTLTLVRGEAESEWEVECGDREAEQFNLPAGGPFTARIAPPDRDVDGLVLWRLSTVAPEDVQDCEDDIAGCGV
ncbi:hypothetical protein ABZ614_14435 [Streptomyces sp. NPDC013178]|uniref:hypothetical protein n=1 Tax=Streptomyces sp. NPDC013178 TaxID=3155118 RepID=UPI0033E68570